MASPKTYYTLETGDCPISHMTHAVYRTKAGADAAIAKYNADRGSSDPAFRGTIDFYDK